ncbi:MAG: hypothetical protein ACR2PM_10755 [Hyphomicrobiales bacterium]
MSDRKSETTWRAGPWVRCFFAPALLVLTLSAQAAADPREERTGCWESYNICVVGAGRAEAWRTVCYSDYSVCMKNPPELQCRDEDKANCTAVRKECAGRSDGSEVSRYHCREDQQVCLDAFGC